MQKLKKLSFISLIMFSCLAKAMFISENLTETNLKPDLEFIYETIVQNHPGMYNELDPKFKENLEHNYKIAQESLLKESDIDKQKQIIANFTRSFDDCHLGVNWRNNQKKETSTEKVTPSDDCNKNKKTEIDTRKFELTNLNENVSWITLPTFQLNSEQSKNAFKGILEQIPNLRHKKAIIFDIRGNTGGKSMYGNEIVNCLFGDYARQKKFIANKNVFVDHRASEVNLAWIKDNWKPSNSYLIKLIEKIQKSIDQKKPYYSNEESKKDDFKNYENLDNESKKLSSHGVTAKIIVVIDYQNASAALSFIDDLKVLDYKITLIGKKTDADRLYMDICSLNLPSKQGTFIYPMLIIRNRPRGDNEPYTPDIEYETTDTEKLQKYILEIVD